MSSGGWNEPALRLKQLSRMAEENLFVVDHKKALAMLKVAKEKNAKKDSSYPRECADCGLHYRGAIEGSEFHGSLLELL